MLASGGAHDAAERIRGISRCPAGRTVNVSQERLRDEDNENIILVGGTRKCHGAIKIDPVVDGTHRHA
eukprot:9871272-Prorocentrum_lima.AAC.1